MSRTESLSSIMQGVAAWTPPTPEEEKALVRRVADGDKQAEDELVSRNLRLVLDVARRYKTPGASLEDLVQEGTIGLIKAARKFDPERGFRFSTFAHWWIRQAISRFVKGPTRLIRLPEYLQDRIARAFRAREDLSVDLGREPSEAEVAQEAGVKEGQVSDLMRLSRDAASLDAPVGGSGAISVEDTVSTERLMEPDELAHRNRSRSAMVKGLGRLNPRETRILAYRYGLADGKSHSRPWIGKQLGLSAERVRQIERVALKSLRDDVDAQLSGQAA